MKILVINAGSTSLKYQLIDSESEEVLAKGLCERIGAGGHLKYDSSKTGEKKDLVVDYKTDQNICPEEHFGQIECYRNAICEMMGIEPENVECVLYYLRHRKAVKV